MEQVVMPELITPKFAEILAENPEMLKMIIDHQPNEEVIVGQNCTMDCNGNPTNVKLVFCNVSIKMEDTEDEQGKRCGEGETNEQVGSCHIKIGGNDFGQIGLQWSGLSRELNQLKLEVAVLEERKNIFESMLRIIPRHASTRKLIAKCKTELNEALENLIKKKKELEFKAGAM